MENLTEKIIFAAILVALLVFFGTRFLNKVASQAAQRKRTNIPQPPPSAEPAQQNVPPPTTQAAATPSKKSARKYLKPALVILLAAGVVWTAGIGIFQSRFSGKNNLQQNNVLSKTVTNLSYGVPAEIAIPIICGCESTGVPGVIQHYEDDGKTPLKNRPRAGKEPTTALGGCQIVTSLHEKRAKDEFKLDIRTPEGNLAYAKVLYGESGTKHWEADPDSVRCWEPKLKAYTWGGEAVTLVVIAPKGQWSNPPTLTPKRGQTSLDGFGKKYTVLWNGQIEEELPRAEGVKPKNPPTVSFFQLKSRDTDDVPITVKFF